MYTYMYTCLRFLVPENTSHEFLAGGIFFDLLLNASSRHRIWTPSKALYSLVLRHSDCWGRDHALPFLNLHNSFVRVPG